MRYLKPVADWWRPAFERWSPQAQARPPEAAAGRPLRCRRCGAHVTDRGAAIRVSASHAHRFRNPAGIPFHFGCFRRAPGCRDQGPATTQHSWFPGAAWSLSRCATCTSHLGWHLVGAGVDFFGLILERLREY